MRVTAGDDDLCLWILVVNAANGGASVLVSRGGDGTSIEDDDFGLCGGIGARQTPITELTFEGSTVGLGGTAPEVLHIKRRHENYYTERRDVPFELARIGIC